MVPAGNHLRTLFAAAFVAAQVGLVATAGKRPDAAFGFRMFQESSTIHVQLFRDVVPAMEHGAVGAPTRVPVLRGAWQAKGARGGRRAFAWRDRVKRPELSTFDVEIHASYGADAQIARWRAALDDVATHLEDDAETSALVLVVTVRRNGGEPETETLTRAVDRAGVPAGGR